MESEGKKKRNKSQIQIIDWWLPEVWGEGWAKWVKEVKMYQFTVIELKS